MKHCTTDKCPQVLDSSCVFYEGTSLIFSGINTNDSVETVIQKLNLKLESFPVVNSNNYYKKTETYSQTEINGFLSGKQNTIGYIPEDSANKSDSYTISSSTTYASTKALIDGLATKLDKGGYKGTAQDLYDRFEGENVAQNDLINGLQDTLDLKVDKSIFSPLSTNYIPFRHGSGIFFNSPFYVDTTKGDLVGLNKTNPTEYLDVNGNVKSNSYKFTLPTTITAQPNMLIPKVDGTRPIWYNNSSIGNDLAFSSEVNVKLNKPTITSTTASYPYVVGEDGSGNSARLPAGDLGKNFFNSDLSNTTARNHTMNAGVTVNTLGNPHTLSGLPNKNADITNFRKVRVQNASGLDSVVDSKNLLTDGMTSMSDAEKDAWRLAQRKSNENYNTAAPQISVINPFLIKNTDDFPLSVAVTGSNLFIDLSNSIVTMKRVKNINGETVSDQPINITNNVTTNSINNSVLLIYYNFHNTPTGYYEVKIQNDYGLQNLTSPQFLIVENYDLTPMLPFTVINSFNELVNNTTINNNAFEVNLVPNVYGGILFDKLYNSTNGNINCIMDLDLSIQIPRNDYVFGEILLGLINNDSTNNISLTTFPKIGFKISQPNAWTVRIIDINTNNVLHTIGWGESLVYYSKFKIFIKDGTYIITNIVTGQVSQGFYNDFNELRFLISKNYSTPMAGGRLSVSVSNFKKI